MGDCDAACCVDFTTVASCLRSPIRVVSFCRNSIEGCPSDGVIERERHAGELIQAVSACAIDCCNSVQTRSFSFKRLRVSLSFLAGCRKVNNNFLLMFVEFLMPVWMSGMPWLSLALSGSAASSSTSLNREDTQGNISAKALILGATSGGNNIVFIARSSSSNIRSSDSCSSMDDRVSCPRIASSKRCRRSSILVCAR